MKRTKNSAVLKFTGLAFYLCLIACSSEQLVGEALPIEIEATIPALTKAITEKTAFEDGNEITVTQDGSGSSAKYAFDGANSRWKPASGSTPITTTNGGTFKAVWKPDGFTAILGDQSVEGNYAKSNQLTATATTTTNLVTFQFAPAAAKLTIVITYQNDVTEGKATVSGQKLLDGTTTSNQTVTCYPVVNTGKRHSFVALVYPGSSLTFVISASSKEEPTPKTHKVENSEIKPGYNYTYNFSTDNRKLLILNNVTVTGFTKQPDTSAGDAT